MEITTELRAIVSARCHVPSLASEKFCAETSAVPWVLLFFFKAQSHVLMCSADVMHCLCWMPVYLRVSSLARVPSQGLLFFFFSLTGSLECWSNFKKGPCSQLTYVCVLSYVCVDLWSMEEPVEASTATAAERADARRHGHVGAQP